MDLLWSKLMQCQQVAAATENYRHRAFVLTDGLGTSRPPYTRAWSSIHATRARHETASTGRQCFSRYAFSRARALAAEHRGVEEAQAADGHVPAAVQHTDAGRHRDQADVTWGLQLEEVSDSPNENLRRVRPD